MDQSVGKGSTPSGPTDQEDLNRKIHQALEAKKKKEKRFLGLSKESGSLGPSFGSAEAGLGTSLMPKPNAIFSPMAFQEIYKF
jgi:hypothetical protein